MSKCILIGNICQSRKIILYREIPEKNIPVLRYEEFCLFKQVTHYLELYFFISEIRMNYLEFLIFNHLLNHKQITISYGLTQ